jgi:hypothetical protein
MTQIKRIDEEWEMFCQRVIDVLTETGAGRYDDIALDRVRERVQKMSIPPLIADKELEEKSPLIKSLLTKGDKEAESVRKFMKSFTFLKIETLKTETPARPGKLRFLGLFFFSYLVRVRDLTV